jgi:hypothetical protein
LLEIYLVDVFKVLELSAVEEVLIVDKIANDIVDVMNEVLKHANFCS